MKVLKTVGAAILIGAALMTPLAAQGTRDDYRRAERFLPANVTKLAWDGEVRPSWIGRDPVFWYRKDGPRGREFRRVDVAGRSSAPAFDHARLAATLARASGQSVTATALPFESFTYGDDGQSIRFEAAGQRWRCQLAKDDCTGEKIEDGTVPRADVPSPDGRYSAFVRNFNLYLRVTATGEEIRLTSDGEKDNAYATPLPSLGLLVRQGTEDVVQTAAVVWSPDSKRLATYQMDQRGFPRLTAVQAAPPDGFRPKAFDYAYTLAVDDELPRARPVVFDVETRQATRVSGRPILQYYYGGPTFTWFPDNARFHYREVDRGYTAVRLVEVDASTGRARTILEETGTPQVYSYILSQRFINDGAEVIWSSQRDGWLHFYLYDVRTGALKNQITKGEWVVRGIDYVDEQARVLYFSAGGREPGDPYLRRAYRINLDGSGLQLLTPEDADHFVSFSPDGAHMVDVYSRVDLPTRAVIRAPRDGSVVMEVDRAEVDPLLSTGWRYPEPFTAKGRDGTTDIYGLIWRPTNFDPSKRYPVIEQIYTGPHSAFVPKTFAAFRNHAQATAELGFITVFIDGMGTAWRSKAFHDVSWRNLGDGGMAEHIGMIRAMAARYPYMDLARVGIFGHSAGGYDSTHAILTHPDFYKVAVSSAGNHDHRMDKAVWNEQWMGWPIDTHYVEQSNYTAAPNLAGKLFLAHGDVDDNVPVTATLKLVDALIAANKDFDLLILPNRNHGFGGDPYFVRRRWDFFVEHLLGVAPPVGYRIGEGAAR